MQVLRRDAFEIRHLGFAAAVGLVLSCLWGCQDGADDKILRIAITTSMRDSGIADQLIPLFEKSESCEVIVLAVGTGAALKLGANGDVDAVFAHSREAEEAFVAAGHGLGRRAVMQSDFLIAGPKNDPAGVKGMKVADALRRICQQGARFISRGDDSGTHKREAQLWKLVDGYSPWSEYIESGRGMGATAEMAHELRCYLLIDRGTFARVANRLDLVELVSGGANLINPYSVIRVNPDRRPAAGVKLAEKFAEFLIGPEAQDIIRNYEVGGVRVFKTLTPKAG
ncbi:MAG: substrate-binding domain-containing protein [Planctomycetota bacterium]